MAEESAAEKTEDATDRKKRQSREQGTVAMSKDLSAAVVVFSAVIFLRYGGMLIFEQIFNTAAYLIEASCTLPVPVSDEGFSYNVDWFILLGRCIGPFTLVLFVIALAIGFSQVGFAVSWSTISLKVDKLNPVAGFMRLFAMKNMVMLVMNLSKVAVVATVAYFSIQDELINANGLVALGVKHMIAHIAQAVLDLAVRLAAVMLILALADYWYQRFQWEKDLRMTKQEIKEEMRDTDGDPHVKSKRRAIQRQLAMQRMMSEVPKAEVVVRNPTHYAVALAYNPEKEEFPTVVAKGVDGVALRIVKIAMESGVAVRYQPPLARNLYRLEIGDPVPEELWHAVVEVLSWVYRQDKEKGKAAQAALARSKQGLARAG